MTQLCANVLVYENCDRRCRCWHKEASHDKYCSCTGASGMLLRREATMKAFFIILSFVLSTLNVRFSCFDHFKFEYHNNNPSGYRMSYFSSIFPLGWGRGCADWSEGSPMGWEKFDASHQEQIPSCHSMVPNEFKINRAVPKTKRPSIHRYLCAIKYRKPCWHLHSSWV
jgi:hypothetical protein